jgi:hypothetical protein
MPAVLTTTLAVAVDGATAEWTLTSVTGVRVGHIVVCGAEQAQVIRAGPGRALTLLRGVNGTAAAAHAASVAVDVYVPNDLVAVGTPLPPFAAVGDVRTGQGPTAAPIYAASAPNLLHQATVVLTNAQIIALNASPFELVAAPGANKVTLFTEAILLGHCPGGLGWSDAVGTDAQLYVRTDVVNENVYRVSDSLAAIQEATADSVGITLDTFFMAASAIAVLRLRVAGENMNADAEHYGRMWLTPGVANVALQLRLNNPFDEGYDVGDPLNTLTVHTFYRILNLTTGLFE